MNEQHELLGIKYSNLVEGSTLTFSEIAAMKNKMGVYMIYSPGNQIIYIGSTNKFHVRFGTDLKHESTHTLMRKLLKKNEFKDRKSIFDYLLNECSYKIEICNTKREAEALEHFAIWTLNPQYNR